MWRDERFAVILAAFGIVEYALQKLHHCSGTKGMSCPGHFTRPVDIQHVAKLIEDLFPAFRSPARVEVEIVEIVTSIDLHQRLIRHTDFPDAYPQLLVSRFMDFISERRVWNMCRVHNVSRGIRCLSHILNWTTTVSMIECDNDHTIASQLTANLTVCISTAGQAMAEESHRPSRVARWRV